VVGRRRQRQILALSGPRLALSRLTSAVLQASGRPQLELILACVSLVVLTPGFFLGARHGINGVAVAFTVLGWCLLPLALVPAARVVGTNARHAVWVLWPIVAATGIMAACSETSRRLITGEVPDVLALLLVVLTGALIYTVALFAMDRDLLRSVLRSPPSRRDVEGEGQRTPQ
jgi:O-antigen/teichoic acid export membrane protein